MVSKLDVLEAWPKRKSTGSPGAARMADEDSLTEELVVRHGGQYDPELLLSLIHI